jgi:hypothetical protein
MELLSRASMQAVYPLAARRVKLRDDDLRKKKDSDLNFKAYLV